MRVWLLRCLVFLLVTLGASFISVLVYDHTMNQENMLQFRAMQRTEVLENVGKLLLEWRHSGADDAIHRYLKEQQEQGRSYTLFDAQGNVIAGSVPDQTLLKLVNQTLQNGGYEYSEAEHHLLAPPMDQPLKESVAFTGRDGTSYALSQALDRQHMPPAGKPNPIIFIVIGACFAVLLHYACLRAFASYTREFRAAMRLLAQGDFGVRVNSSMERQKNCFSSLAKDFNQTVTSLAGKQAEQRYLIADLTHDMRSSLTRMALAMELARNTSPNRATQLLSRIKVDSDKLNQISEQLMTHVRQQWNDTQRTPLQLADFLRPLIRELNTHARESGKRVLFYNRHNCRILGNESQLASMIRNIVNNGLRHSPNGGYVIVTLEKAADDKSARITIQDEGPGLPQEMLREVFEPFKQGENKGESGLGLAIAKLVSERHGGSITLSNRPAAGLEASILLPLMQPEPQKEAVDSCTQEAKGMDAPNAPETPAWPSASQH